MAIENRPTVEIDTAQLYCWGDDSMLIADWFDAGDNLAYDTPEEVADVSDRGPEGIDRAIQWVRLLAAASRAAVGR